MVETWHHHAPPIQIVAIIFALLLIIGRGYALDLPAADSVVSFFSGPWPWISFTLVMVAPVFFFKYFPGSIAYFVAGLILYLSLRAGA